MRARLTAVDTPLPERQTKPDREAVKTLAIAVGVREAARQTGINQNTILSWSKRDQWFVDPPKPQSVQVQQGKAISAIKQPSTALTEILAERKDQTKLNLSKYAVEASKDAAEHKDKLKISRQVKDAAAVASHVWPEEKSNDAGLSLQVLSIGGELSVNLNRGEKP